MEQWNNYVLSNDNEDWRSRNEDHVEWIIDDLAIRLLRDENAADLNTWKAWHRVENVTYVSTDHLYVMPITNLLHVNRIKYPPLRLVCESRLKLLSSFYYYVCEKSNYDVCVFFDNNVFSQYNVVTLSTITNQQYVNYSLSLIRLRSCSLDKCEQYWRIKLFHDIDSWTTRYPWNMTRFRE